MFISLLQKQISWNHYCWEHKVEVIAGSPCHAEVSTHSNVESSFLSRFQAACVIAVDSTWKLQHEHTLLPVASMDLPDSCLDGIPDNPLTRSPSFLLLLLFFLFYLPALLFYICYPHTNLDSSHAVLNETAKTGNTSRRGVWRPFFSTALLRTCVGVG